MKVKFEFEKPKDVSSGFEEDILMININKGAEFLLESEETGRIFDQVEIFSLKIP